MQAECREQLLSLLEGEPDPIARMASMASVLMGALPQASFAGFYRLVEPDLLLIGPYQGPPACLRIRRGQGVCGAAVATGRSVLVPDVHAFPGHIACDSRARSELVVPVHDTDGSLMGVLDLDSHERAAFDETDQRFVEELVSAVFGQKNR